MSAREAVDVAEVVERLRDWSQHVADEDWNYSRPAMLDAADLITRLVAEREAAEAALAELREKAKAFAEGQNCILSPGNRNLDQMIRDMGFACDAARAFLASLEGHQP